MNKISIIVPVYNTEKYLEKCINSICQQTYKEIEILLINDGSNDSSFEICRKFEKRDSRIKLINKSNTGVADTRNIGIENATGKYIMFVDSDDWIEKNTVEIIMKKINNFDLLIFGINKRYKNKFVEMRTKNEKINQIDCTKKVINNSEISGYVWNKVFKNSVIKQNQLQFNDKLSMCEDLDFTINFLNKIDNVIIIDDTLYNYRMRKNGLTHNGNDKAKKIKDLMYVYDKEYQFLNDNKFDCGKVDYDVTNQYYSNREKEIRDIIKEHYNYDFYKKIIMIILNKKISKRKKIEITLNFINPNLIKKIRKKRNNKIFYD